MGLFPQVRMPVFLRYSYQVGTDEGGIRGGFGAEEELLLRGGVRRSGQASAVDTTRFEQKGKPEATR